MDPFGFNKNSQNDEDGFSLINGLFGGQKNPIIRMTKTTMMMMIRTMTTRTMSILDVDLL